MVFKSSPLTIVGFPGQTTVVGPATPTLVQHVAFGSNPAGLGISGDNFKVQLPQPIGAGNCLELSLTYPHGNTPTVTDNNGNSWPGSPTAGPADAGVGNYVAAKFVLLNANAGQTLITVAFGASIIPVQIEISEWYNVGSVNGTASSGASPVTGPNLACGSFTPTTNNDSNGGNVISAYFPIASGAAGNPSAFVPVTSVGNFKLLNADIGWVNNQGFPHASMYWVQGTQAAINPSMTATAGTGSANSYNCVAVALKAANVGTPGAAFRILRILHYSVPFTATTGTYILHTPTEGNLGVIADAVGTTQITIASGGCVDNDSNTWTREQPAVSTTCPYFFMLPSATANTNRKVTITYSGKTTTGCSWRFWDIVGAAVSPFDTMAGFPDTAITAGVTVLDNAPSISPGTTSKELVIAVLGLGQGPVTGFDTGAPAGAVMDNITYTGQNDIDLIDNADGVAHVYTTSTTQLNWNWIIPTNAGDGYATAIAFKGA